MRQLKPEEWTARVVQAVEELESGRVTLTVELEPPRFELTALGEAALDEKPAA